MGTVTAGLLRINKTFKLPTRAKLYARRPWPIKAIRMDIEFEIETSNGNLSGLPGEYLVQDEKGNFHSMSQEKFENEYEVITIGSV